MRYPRNLQVRRLFLDDRQIGGVVEDGLVLQVEYAPRRRGVHAKPGDLQPAGTADGAAGLLRSRPTPVDGFGGPPPRVVLRGAHAMQQRLACQPDRFDVLLGVATDAGARQSWPAAEITSDCDQPFGRRSL